MKKQTALRQILLRTMVAFTFILGSGGLARAQWLTHTYTSNTPPTSQTTNAIFPGATAGYVGSVNVSTSNFVDGTGNGYVGISPSPFTAVTPTFNSLFPLNPGSTFDYLNVGYNDTGDKVTVTFDFTGLAFRYLPAGTIAAFLDVDSLETIQNMTAIDPAGNIITAPWLSPLASPRDLFDYNNLGGDGLIPGAEANYSQLGGVYNFNGKATNDSSAFLGFSTLVDIRSLTFTLGNSGPVTPNSPGGYGVALGAPVPEPSSLALLAVGVALAGWCLRPRSSHSDIHPPQESARV
jgi:hypothetical protein